MSGFRLVRFLCRFDTVLGHTVAISLWCAYNARRLEFGWRILMPFILVFAESGALYTINVLASLVMHIRGSLGQLIAIDMQPSIVVSHNPGSKSPYQRTVCYLSVQGIIYCLIILQIKFKVDLIGRRTTSATGILDVSCTHTRPFPNHLGLIIPSRPWRSMTRAFL